MTNIIHLTCPPIFLCSWWGTLTLSWYFLDLHCSRSEGGVAWTGWGSRRPGPSCFCHRGVSRDCWAPTLTRSGRPGWWAPPRWVAAQTSLFSSAQTKKKTRVISFSRMNSLWLRLHQKRRRKKSVTARDLYGYTGLWSYLGDLLITSLPDTRDVAARPQEIQGWWWVKSEKCYTDR